MCRRQINYATQRALPRPSRILGASAIRIIRESARLSSRLRTFLEAVANNPNLSKKIVSELQNSGAIEATQAEAKRRVMLAQSALHELPDTLARKVLELMSDAVIDRTY